MVEPMNVSHTYRWGTKLNFGRLIEGPAKPETFINPENFGGLKMGVENAMFNSCGWIHKGFTYLHKNHCLGASRALNMILKSDSQETSQCTQ